MFDKILEQPKLKLICLTYVPFYFLSLYHPHSNSPFFVYIATAHVIIHSSLIYTNQTHRVIFMGLVGKVIATTAIVAGIGAGTAVFLENYHRHSPVIQRTLLGDDEKAGYIQEARDELVNDVKYTTGSVAQKVIKAMGEGVDEYRAATQKYSEAIDDIHKVNP
jgi:hypothetical protein